MNYKVSSGHQVGHCCDRQAWRGAFDPFCDCKRADRWFVEPGVGWGGGMREVKYHALHIMCPQMGGDICIPLFYCQQRCLNLIKRLIAFLCFDSLGWRMTKSKQVRLAWPLSSNSKYISPPIMYYLDGWFTISNAEPISSPFLCDLLDKWIISQAFLIDIMGLRSSMGPSVTVYTSFISICPKKNHK